MNSARLAWTRLTTKFKTRLGSLYTEFESSRVKSRVTRLAREFRVLIPALGTAVALVLAATLCGRQTAFHNGVSRWLLPWCSSPICELSWSISGGGRALVTSAMVLLSRRLRWLSVACARVRTDRTTYLALHLLLLIVVSNSGAVNSVPVVAVSVGPCFVRADLLCKVGSASYICFVVEDVINLTSGLWTFI
jgi:hypothetical protein